MGPPAVEWATDQPPAATTATPVNAAFEVFVKGAISRIKQEAWGRSQEVKDIREKCSALLDRMSSPSTRHQFSAPLDDHAAMAVLEPLELACHSDVPKVMEPALGCLHKLVSHAWLQADATPAHEPQEHPTVTKVIRLMTKAGESSSSNVQLSVIRGLLTVCTAEHFLAHGDSLIRAIRCIFNLSVGSEDANIKLTACNALLQILNTVVKRITTVSIWMERIGCESLAGTASTASECFSNSVSGHGPSQSTSPEPTRGASTEAASGSAQLPQGKQDSPSRAPGSEGPGPAGDAGASAALVMAQDPARTARLAALAEQRDMKGLEAALGPSPYTLAPSGVAAASASQGDHGAQHAQGPSELCEKAASRAAGAGKQAAGGEGHAVEAAGKSEELTGPFHSSATVQAAQGPEELNLVEKDVLLVITALCKLAAREVLPSDFESFMQQGKLLALELLVKVLESPQHNWELPRPPFFLLVRQPLSLALLRNSMGSDPKAFKLACQLFVAALTNPQLRAGLKAELGALYPLLMLRPLESEQKDPSQLTASIQALSRITANSQLLVDLFINYDCDIEAGNLYERTMRALSQIAVHGDRNAPVESSAALHDFSIGCLHAALSSLDSWSGPIRDAMASSLPQPDSMEDKDADEQPSTGEPSQSLHSGPAAEVPGDAAKGGGAQTSEAQKFKDAKERKLLLQEGILLFNRSAAKGIKRMVSSGVLQDDPGAIATFLRSHSDLLDKEQLGEYLGDHEEGNVATMHAWLDKERYSDQEIDVALRKLLLQFKLPGEAQKIDRIMEKFAERYCKDNPGRFAQADGAYMLAFSIIMLNTDQHNPMAEKMMTRQGFVEMNCLEPADPADPWVQVLPTEELAAIYDRIVEEEIQMINDSSHGAAGGKDGGSSRTGGGTALRLAAAAGLPHFFAPFRSGYKEWSKPQGLAAEKRRLMEAALATLMRGPHQSDESRWFHGSHAEHARPMLEMAGPPLLDAIGKALDMASDLEKARRVLDMVGTGLRLAALLSLPQITKKFMQVLCSATGVFAEGAPDPEPEACQVAALRLLTELGVSPEAGMIGQDCWWMLLHCLSQLEARYQAMPRPGAGGAPALHQHSPTHLLSPTLVAAAGGFSTNGRSSSPNGGSSSAGAKLAAASLSTAVTSVGRFFSTLGMSTAAADRSSPVRPGRPAGLGRHSGFNLRGSSPTQQRPSPGTAAARSANGQALPAGSAGAAAPAPASAFPGSAVAQWALGEGATAVDNVFMSSSALDGRAVLQFIAALCAVSHEEIHQAEQPRVYMLTKLVECAYYNMDRIRLVWVKIWHIISGHLVAAACTPSQDDATAKHAVDSLRQLVIKILARAGFDRLMALLVGETNGSAKAKQEKALGKRTPQLWISQATELENFSHQEEALRPFARVLQGSSSAAVKELTVHCLHQAMEAYPLGLGSGWRAVVRALGQAMQDSTPTVVTAALASLRTVIDALYRDSGPASMLLVPCLMAGTKGALNEHHQPLALAALDLLRKCGTCVAEAAASGALPGAGSGAAAAEERALLRGKPADGAQTGLAEPGSRWWEHSNPWVNTIGALAEVAANAALHGIAFQAAAAAFDVVQCHSHRWAGTTWLDVLGCVVVPLFRVPDLSAAAPAERGEEGRFAQEDAQLRQHRLCRMAEAHLPGVLQAVAEQYPKQGSALLQLALQPPLRFVMSCDPALVRLGLALMEASCPRLAPVLDSEGWELLVRSLSLAASADHLHGDVCNPTGPAADAPEAKLAAMRSQCTATVLVQRAIGSIHERCMQDMPASVQLDLLNVLQDTVQRASDINSSDARRATLQVLVPEAPADIDGLRQHGARKVLAMACVPLAALRGQPANGAPRPAPDAAAAGGASPVEARPEAGAEARSSAQQGSKSSSAAEPRSSSWVHLDSAAARNAPAAASNGAADAADAYGQLAAPPPAEPPRPTGAEEAAGSMPSVPADAEAEELAFVRKSSTVPCLPDSQPLPLLAPGTSERDLVPKWLDLEPPDVHCSAAAATLPLTAALLRQETEGTRLLITAYLRCMSSSAAAAALREQAQLRLRAVCERVIVQASLELQGNLPERAPLGGEERVPTPAGAAAPAELACTAWPVEQTLRAPVVVLALRACSEMGMPALLSPLPPPLAPNSADRLQPQLERLWPHLSRLIVSGQPSVRSALSSLLEGLITPTFLRPE